MQYIGVGIVYLMMGAVTYKLVHRWNLRHSETSMKIGKTVYVSGWVVTIGSLIDLIPGVTKNISMLILMVTVAVMVTIVLSIVKRIIATLEYNNRYFELLLDKNEKEEFLYILKKYPEVVFQKDVLAMLASRGRLEEWLGSDVDKFKTQEKALYQSYLLLDVMNRENV